METNSIRFPLICSPTISHFIDLLLNHSFAHPVWLQWQLSGYRVILPNSLSVSLSSWYSFYCALFTYRSPFFPLICFAIYAVIPLESIDNDSGAWETHNTRKTSTIFIVLLSIDIVKYNRQSVSYSFTCYRSLLFTTFTHTLKSSTIYASHFNSSSLMMRYDWLFEYVLRRVSRDGLWIILWKGASGFIHACAFPICLHL